MSTPKKLQALLGIAAMLKDRDMAALAGLTARKSGMLEQIAALRTARQAAMQQALHSLEAASAAEKHALWTAQREAGLRRRIADVQAEIDQQIAQTTRSVGRHANLTKLSTK